MANRPRRGATTGGATGGATVGGGAATRLGGVRPSSMLRPRPGDLVLGPDGSILNPGALAWLRPVRNLFDRSRPGTAAIRPDDLVALRIELRNLTVTPGDAPRLRHAGGGAAFLILHLPPQAITEETFFETLPAGVTNPEDSQDTRNPHPATRVKPDGPAGGDDLRPPPVRARIAHESRLVFRVPSGFDAPYSLEGVLKACCSLPLAVAANAGPRAARAAPGLRFDQLFDMRAVRRLAPWRRVALTSHALRTLRIAAVEADAPTLRLRQAGASAALRPIATDRIAGPILRIRPKPAAPNATTTAIELPWRLLLSPHGGARFRHADVPVKAADGRTELWHTRLAAPVAGKPEIEAGKPDPNRTVRAIWALTGEGSGKAMQGDWPDPQADLPAPDLSPFRMPLDDFDRFQIAHLSSNFSVNGYVPEPVDAELMMLTALGGWLDSRGAWEPPGLSVEEWTHRASMARDHYVRVVYRGFLFPFGHRVSLVKVSERKFHNGARDANGQPTIEQRAGNPAYLRQRLFIVVRERERRFDSSLAQAARDNAQTVFYGRQFPFSTIRLLTQVTPNLDRPDLPPSDVSGNGQRMFWPHVGDQPFRFQCVGTDLDGRRIAFGLPMIFIDNTLACPRSFNNATKKLEPLFSAAEANAAIARHAYAGGGDKQVADLRRQSVALAPSLKPGDTAVEVETMAFGAEVEAGNQTLRALSEDLARPVCFPKVEEARGRIGALAHLTGSAKANLLRWNAHYLRLGFAQNVGEVFADVVAEPGMAMLDFSAQGDRSGGYVQPNLKPAALSRFAGPVMGDVGAFIKGETPPGGGFPTSVGDLPLPLLFGAIPLGEIVEAVADLSATPGRIPKFVSEAATKLESFVNALARLHGLVSDAAAQPARIGAAAMAAFRATLDDQIAQGKGYAAAQMAPVEAAATQLSAELAGVTTALAALADVTADDPALPGALAALAPAVATARAQVSALENAANANVGGVSLPAGLRQSILSGTKKLDATLATLETLPPLAAAVTALFNALEAIVGDPAGFSALLADAPTLTARLQAVGAAAAGLRGALAAFDLLDGAPRKTLLDALSVVEETLGAGPLAGLIDLLTGDELTIRFDWNPEISSWWLPGANKATDAPLFRVNDRRGFLVAAEARVKKDGSSSPRLTVSCGLKHFDLVMVSPASFLELNFEKIEFSADSNAKTNVDVLLSDIKFIGVLSFVETLRDLIPLDGFSDPPYLDVSAKGIDAGFSLALPSLAIGVLNISNLSLGAGFTVPFIGQPLSVRFNFCTREQPFNLTVSLFGGGGFFGVTVDPTGVQILEAAFEFGASISVNFGVASGGVHVMAGIYYRMEQDAASLAGYFRLGGRVDVLGLISASIELYLELRYEFQSGKCVGKARLTIEISVFLFSGSVTVTCERKFAGSNGDPTLRQLLGHQPALPLDQELALIDDETEYAWRTHCEAFA